MDETAGDSINMIGLHIFSLIFAALFFLATSLGDSSIYILPVALAYFTLIDLALHSPPIKIDIGHDVGDSFLSSFANNLTALGPEQSFLEAQKKAPCPILYPALAEIRNGASVSEALLSVRIGSKSEKALLVAISRTLAYSSDEASVRLRKYLAFRQERQKVMTEYMGKMSVLSFRIKTLFIIAAASLAVIAYASPLLGTLAVGGITASENVISWPLPAIAFLSVSALNPLLYSRIVPNTNGGKTAAACFIIYTSIFLALGFTIGWRF